MIGHIPLSADDQAEGLYFGNMLLRKYSRNVSLREEAGEERSMSVAEKIIHMFFTPTETGRVA
ncbi:MAG: hypothetical protein M0P11_09690 [Anaerolineaceae bacterium]|uniref:hypothetical protein n=1 Tax=Pseudomonadaceae TaxID=135621 RepID=UPI0011B0D923|nr:MULTISPECIES: hypothetical protein [Pseudomonadaceae]MCK9247205.1 hypothetical protein [Anaerolineaceae bacterium]